MACQETVITALIILAFSNTSSGNIKLCRIYFTLSFFLDGRLTSEINEVK